MPTSWERVHGMSKDDIQEVVRQGAALIAGTRETQKSAAAEETEKAAPVEETEKAIPEAFLKGKEDKDEDEDKDTKETEKALFESPAFAAAVEAATARAVEKALPAALEAALAPVLQVVEKSAQALTVVDSKVSASLEHQAASTDVLAGMRETTKALKANVEQIQDEVDVIGAQPAGRKSVDTRETEKSVTEVQAETKTFEFDMDKVREVTKSMDPGAMVTIRQLARRGDAEGVRSRLTPAQRAVIGL